jgi:hypothetical protein
MKGHNKQRALSWPRLIVMGFVAAAMVVAVVGLLSLRSAFRADVAPAAPIRLQAAGASLSQVRRVHLCLCTQHHEQTFFALLLGMLMMQ